MKHRLLFEKLYQASYGYRPLFGGNRTRFLVLLRYFKEARLRRPAIVLDVGCGTGTFSLEFAKTKAIVIGIDISRTAIKMANKLAKHASLNNISFVIGDAEHLPFRSECCDICFHSELLEHVLNPELVVKETARVLKKGGLLIASIPSANKYSFEWIISKLKRKIIRVKEGLYLFYLDTCPRIGHPMFHRFTSEWIIRNYFKYGVVIEKIEYHAHIFTPLIELIYNTVKHHLNIRSTLHGAFKNGTLYSLLVEILNKVCSLDYFLLRKVPCGSNMMILGRKH